MKKMLFLLVPLLFFGTMAYGQFPATGTNQVTINITEYVTFTISPATPIVFTVDQENEPQQQNSTATWEYRSNTTTAKRIYVNITGTNAITDPIVAGTAANHLDLSANFTLTANTMTTPPTPVTTPTLISGGVTPPAANINFVTGLINGTANGGIVYTVDCVGNPIRPADGAYTMTITYTCDVP